ncbi:Outer membrane efflux protein BepC precursor [Marinobacterium sp. xm-d-579]|uniref:TolC family outer membrane protein n=1 Tax=Marinobacterium sp. xm-d-579 TaxID=2497734 RepID=UPI001568B991|nr:TolC family outer membrane protein [Marinobacterium sp. xm-d-579]NRP36537.1 Outer membrane efflux protein BepC precursor [Marinobacterium sp. xm-d-579]
MRQIIAISLLFSSLSLSFALTANANSTFDKVISEALLNNPSVNAAWYNFEAAAEEQRSAEGGYYPSIDLDMDAGTRWSKSPGADLDDYHHSTATLTLTQMIYDGNETRNQVARLSHERRARYFEFKYETEQAAFQAVNAYVDVAREQKLLALTKENYVEHRKIYDQILERVEQGVGRGVDLEQANGRLALAETNLLTEVANLHDVSARYQRMTNLQPEDNLEDITLNTDLIGSDANSVLKTAYQEHPFLMASTESVMAAQADKRVREAANQPKLDLRVRDQHERNRSGNSGNYRDMAVELVLSFNLYNGGGDAAAIRQYQKAAVSAETERLAACYDIRQEAMVAFNAVNNLQSQISLLEQNTLSISKARVAYRGQFDIGQRTLLDLLDTENEYFETRRALVNAQSDLTIAKARTLSAMGLLVRSFDDRSFLRVADDVQAPSNEGYSLCPEQPSRQYSIDREALLTEVMSGQ